MDINNYIHSFKDSIKGKSLPTKFTFPFYYTPHELTQLAARQLQSYLSNQNEWQHNFGLQEDQEGMVIGKMFGVMIVQQSSGAIGFLAAYSGKLANSNNIPGFVPPIFDMLDKNGYYKTEESKIDLINEEISLISSDTIYNSLKEELHQKQKEKNQVLSDLRKEFNQSRKERRILRKKAENELSSDRIRELHEKHKSISLKQQNNIKRVTWEFDLSLENISEKLNVFETRLKRLKEDRKRMSNMLQKWLFDQYNFYNAKGETKNVVDIFSETALGSPPAGAGECAAPKLLQFAYQHDLKPICFGEFWWGRPPKSEVRKHGSFYPSCKGKCEPILNHMLEGLDVEENPLLINSADKKLEVIFEDEHLMVLDKPAELLSVPGRTYTDSVYTRMRKILPEQDNPIIIHRLDMSTSGILVISKNKVSHKILQKQFLERTIKKKYIADLEGELKDTSGIISLPLKQDYVNRPQQKVCFKEGKPAKTKWNLLGVKNKITRVEFFPITGRTHQLRVHAAHVDGLNAPIVGDDIYGSKGERLHLHAAFIEFRHPFSKELLQFNSKVPF